MKSLIIVIYCCFTLISYSQTYVAGNVAGFWEKSGNPYIVTANITIPKDSALYISPGTQVLFDGHYKFQVYGLLKAVGTENDSILFSRLNKDSTWFGIRFFNANSNSVIQYSIIEYCYNYSENNENEGAGIYCKNSNVTIANNSIRRNYSFTDNLSGGGIFCINSQPLIKGNIISKNIGNGGGGSGIHIINSACKIMDNNISFNESRDIIGSRTPKGGGIVSVQSAAIIQNNLIFKNRSYEGGGIACVEEPANEIINNTIVYNVAEGTSPGGIVSYHSPTIIINNIIFYNGWDEQIKINYVGGIVKNNNIENYYNYDPSKENFYLDPNFIDIPKEDFHVNSNSPCIDAGNKTSFYTLEPFYNGQRINIGAYGNTSEAAPSQPMYETTLSAFIFDTLEINQVQSKDFTIKSIGITRLNIDTILIEDDMPYLIEYSGLKSLLNGDSSKIKITFNPKYPGEFNTNLKIITNVLNKEIIKIPISGFSPFLNSPTITSIHDVPNDQGGWVLVNFTKSVFDTDTLQLKKRLSPEVYTVEINNGSGWIGVLSTVAYNKSEYSVLVPTTMDSTSEHDGKLSFRVIAGMEEGNYISESKLGYSKDNLSPEAPSELSISLLENSNVKLSWEGHFEKDFKYFSIYKKIKGNFKQLIQTIDTVYIDHNTELNQNYYYAISASDFSGNESNFSEFSEIYVTNIKQEQLVSSKYFLNQNYPNPFNPYTTIKYGLEKPTHVSISIFNINGEKIKDLVDAFQKNGTYEVIWNGTNKLNQTVSSGIYYYKIITGDFNQVRKMILLK